MSFFKLFFMAKKAALSVRQFWAKISCWVESRAAMATVDQSSMRGLVTA
jgi:hypothetical protein